MNKRIILVLSFLTLMLTTLPIVAGATITTATDSFSGATQMASEAKNLGDISYTYFAKVKDKDTFVTAMRFTQIKTSWHFFSNQDMQMKIDDSSIYSIKVLRTNIVDGYSSKGTSVTFIIDDLANPGIKDAISNAKKITVRVYYQELSPATFDIPTPILQEWQQVINS